mmetsp:Transcript_60611/g.145877  ORF Transcript_60611/g.145877 Transcript_60611/m.145877 type:complete len:114 (-) Transcript_60611:68-409(-)
MMRVLPRDFWPEVKRYSLLPLTLLVTDLTRAELVRVMEEVRPKAGGLGRVNSVSDDGGSYPSPPTCPSPATDPSKGWVEDCAVPAGKGVALPPEFRREENIPAILRPSPSRSP